MNKEEKPGVSKVAFLVKHKVKRVLGVWDLFAIGYGDLGSSIYYALGVTALFALGATPIALAIAGLVFICTALSYAELSSVYHEAGGSASFARQAFNDLSSFISGWGLLLDYIVTIAISAFAIGPYLSVFFPALQGRYSHIGFTAAIIVFLYFLNLFGVKRSTRVSMVLAFFAILTQIIIIVLGVFFVMNLPQVFEHLRVGVKNVTWSPTWTEFFRGVAMAMVAYTGIESIAQLGSEAKSPSKNLPRAIFFNMFALIVLYVGISIVGLSVLTPQELGTTYIKDPLAGIANALPVGGKWLQCWVGLFAAILLFVASNAGLIGSSRLAYNMGEYYQLPRFFSHVHRKFRTPHLSLLFFAAFALIIIIASRGRLSFLADLYNFGAMIAFFSTNLSLLVLRVKKPKMHRPFKVPFNIRLFGYEFPISGIIGCIATSSVWTLIVLVKPEGRFMGLAWMTIGILMFFLYRRKKGLIAQGSLQITTIRAPHFAPLNIKRLLIPIHSVKEHDTIRLACELAKLHKAHMTIVHVIEVPFSLAVDAFLPGRTRNGHEILQQAEALARSLNIHRLDTVLVRGRYYEDTVLGVAKEQKCDLMILGWKRKIKEKILRNSPCRVWLCTE